MVAMDDAKDTPSATDRSKREGPVRLPGPAKAPARATKAAKATEATAGASQVGQGRQRRRPRRPGRPSRRRPRPSRRGAGSASRASRSSIGRSRARAGRRGAGTGPRGPALAAIPQPGPLQPPLPADPRALAAGHPAGHLAVLASRTGTRGPRRPRPGGDRRHGCSTGAPRP